MPRPGDHIQQRKETVDANEQQLFEGRIANTPSGPGDDVFVLIQEFDEEKHRHGPVRWRALEFNGEHVLPEKGDSCLVAKPSTTGSVWLLAWR